MKALVVIALVLITPLLAQADWVLSPCGRYYYYVQPPPRPLITNNTSNSNTYTYPTKSYQELLVELAQLRERSEGTLLRAQQDHKSFLEALGAFGIRGSYGSLNYSNYGNNYAQVGSVGNTQYGYTAQTILNAYGQTDLNALYLQASQLTRGAQQLSSQAHTEFTGLVGQAGDNQARVAEILARGQAAKQFLDSLEQPKTTINSSSSSFGNANNGPLPPNGINGNGGNGINQQLGAILQAKCAMCHNPNTRRGGFQVNDYFNMSPEERGHVIGLLTTNDPNRRMPRIPDGSRLGQPGALFAEEIELFKR